MSNAASASAAGKPRDRAWVLAALVAFAVSLLLPTFVCPAPNASFPGYTLLALGWTGPLLMEPRWFANPLLAVMLWRLFRGKRAAIWLVPMTAAAVALSAIVWNAYGCEADGGPGMSLGLAAGGYLWVACVTAVSAWYVWRQYAHRKVNGTTAA